MNLKFVVGRDVSVEVYEVKMADKSLYMQHRDHMKQVWECELPVAEDLESPAACYRCHSIEWSA